MGELWHPVKLKLVRFLWKLGGTTVLSVAIVMLLIVNTTDLR